MKLPEEVRKCAFYVVYNDGTRLCFGGTGYFVAADVDGSETHKSFFAVTARHVLSMISRKAVDGKAYLRLNRLNKELGLLPIPLSDWFFHPDDPVLDIALAYVRYQRDWDHLGVHTSLLLNDDVAKAHEVGVGDAVAVTGLFSKHPGTRRNIPIVRTGNLAALIEEPIRVTLPGGTHVDVEAYLIETRSFGGLSGSPVFLNLGDVRRINGEIKYATKPTYFLLGQVFGHWNEEVSTPLEGTSSMTQQEIVNLGISIVIPARHVGEALEGPVARGIRAEVAEILKRQKAVQPQ
jgi:hypothetical protein